MIVEVRVSRPLKGKPRFYFRKPWARESSFVTVLSVSGHSSQNLSYMTDPGRAVLDENGQLWEGFELKNINSKIEERAPFVS